MNRIALRARVEVGTERLALVMEAQWADMLRPFGTKGSGKGAKGLLPWERGPLAFVLGGTADWLTPTHQLVKAGGAWTGPVPPEYVVTRQLGCDEEESCEEPARKRGKHDKLDRAKLYRKPRQAVVPWAVLEEARLTRALERWRWIVESTEPQSCRLHRHLLQAEGEEGVLALLQNVFGAKSTGTMEKRAGSVIAFLRWAESADVPLPALPFTEATVYKCVEHYRSSAAAPTRASSLLEAIPFTTELLGLPWAEEVLGSARIMGAVWRLSDTKGTTHQAPPFTVEAVSTFEMLTELAPTPEERVIAGNICFTIHSRMRVHDAANICNEPVLDVNADGEGFLETSLEGGRTKAGRGTKRRKRLLPAVALATGVTGNNWAHAWCQARAECSLDAEEDGALFLMPKAGGGFTEAKMTAADLTVWERELLIKAGMDRQEAARYSSHSGRATGLSWAAKAGVKKEYRRLLGGHAKPGDMSVLEYSRDALETPLRKLIKVYSMIRSKEFDPDASRANRWHKKGQDMPASSRELPAPHVDEVVSEGSQDEEEREEEDDEEGEDESRDIRADCDIDVLGSCPGEEQPAEARGLRLYTYRPTGTVHIEDGNRRGQLACYRFLTAEHFARDTWGDARRPLCNQCRVKTRLDVSWPPMRLEEQETI